MQLLRVASTMSYQGSPYSGPGDEYDFEDDGYDDLEERDLEDTLPPPAVDVSDEGTFCLRLLSFSYLGVVLLVTLTVNCFVCYCYDPCLNHTSNLEVLVIFR